MNTTLPGPVAGLNRTSTRSHVTPAAKASNQSRTLEFAEEYR